METSVIPPVESTGAGERHAAPETVEKVDFDLNRYREGHSGRSENVAEIGPFGGRTGTETEAMGCSVSSLRSAMETVSLSGSHRGGSVTVVGDDSDTDSIGSEDSEIGASLWNFHRDEALQRLNNEEWAGAEDSINMVLSRYPKQEPFEDLGRFEWQMWLARAQNLQGKVTDALRTLQLMNTNRGEDYGAKKGIETVRLHLAIVDYTFNQQELDGPAVKSASKKAIKLAKRLQKSLASSNCSQEEVLKAQNLLTIAIRQMVVILEQLGEKADARAYKSLLPEESKRAIDEDMLLIYTPLPKASTGSKKIEQRRTDHAEQPSVQPPLLESSTGVGTENEPTQLTSETELMWSPPKARPASCAERPQDGNTPPESLRQYRLRKHNGWILGPEDEIYVKLFDINISEIDTTLPSSLSKMWEGVEIEGVALRYTLEQAIWKAIDENDLEAIHWIYRDPRVKQTKFNYTMSGLQGGCPLHMAVLRNRYHVAKTLLRLGFDVNEIDDKYETALFTTMFVSAEHQLKFVELLVKAGVNVNSQQSEGRVVMHTVAECGTIEVADFLILRGARVHWTDQLGRTPLYEAIRMRRDDMVKCLCEQGAHLPSFTVSGETMKEYAHKRGCDTIVDILERTVQQPFEVSQDVSQKDTEGETSVSIDKKMEKYRLTKRNGFLVQLIGGGHTGTSESMDNRLLDDPNAPKSIQDLRETISKAIRQAVYQDDVEAIKYIYSDTRVPRTKFEITYTPPNKGREATAPPLHAAVDYGFVKIAKIMLNTGVDVNVMDRGGWYHPLCRAIYAPKESRSALVGLLLDRDASVNFISSQDGARPLHMAAQLGDVEISRLLYLKGANINATNMYNETALFLAVKAGHVDMVQWLLLRGADKSIKRTRNKDTPLQYAKRNKMLAIEKLLKKNYK